MRILCLLLLLCVGCMSNDKTALRKATVVSASFVITTPFAIPCDMLDTLLHSALATKNVDRNDLKKLADLLADMQAVPNTSIDVRGKLIITQQDNKEQTLCFDQFGVFYDGTKYSKNEPLLKFMKARGLLTP